jgi:hypothetical protein
VIEELDLHVKQALKFSAPKRGPKTPIKERKRDSAKGRPMEPWNLPISLALTEEAAVIALC